MIKSGLVSITFRKMAPEEIISLVEKSGLQCIEWGGDIHVPHGNIAIAAKVRDMTIAAGLEVAAYGSYYRAGCKSEGMPDFERVAETAAALGAPVIRVWAGNRGSAEADNGWWQAVIEDSLRIAGLAAEYGIRVAFEFHGNTLTDTNEAALRLLDEINHENVYCYWQPAVNKSVEWRLLGLRGLIHRNKLENIHVFQWQGQKRLQLSEGIEEWKCYLKEAAGMQGVHNAMIEFVRDDDPQQFLRDAETLQTILKSI